MTIALSTHVRARGPGRVDARGADRWRGDRPGTAYV